MPGYLKSISNKAVAIIKKLALQNSQRLRMQIIKVS